MSTTDLAFTETTAEDPRILELVRELDTDLAARYPDESCTGGANVRPGIRFLLAEVAGHPAGCCAIQPLPDGAAELKRMYVKPEARGRRLGARLLEHAEMLARTAGHEELRLETAIHQPEAMALYERSGYTPIPSYPPYQDKPLSRCYAKQLNQALTINAPVPGRPVLFVLSVTYTAPIPEIEEHLEQHRDWLEENFKDRTFLVSGPKVPRSGGIILAQGTSIDELGALVATDPFVLAGIARYEITAFEPTRGPLAAALLNNINN